MRKIFRLSATLDRLIEFERGRTLLRKIANWRRQDQYAILPYSSKGLVPPRGDLSASRISNLVKNLRNRKIKPFYYQPGD
jgi:hypothetical protein